MRINNTLTVAELRDLLEQYHDATPVMLAAGSNLNNLSPVTHTLDAGLRSEGDKLVFCRPIDDHKECSIVVLTHV